MNKLTKQKLVAFAILLLVCNYAIAQDKVASWDFPIKPGTEKWKQLETETERLNVLQIPDNILEVIETEELVISCLNYPASIHYTAYDNQFVGFQKVVANFNGLQELLSRNDAGRYLVEHYNNAGADGFITKDDRLDGRYWTVKFTYLELMVSQKEIIQNLEAEERMILLETTLNKLDIKTHNNDVFSKYDDMNSALIVARILECNNVSAIVSNSVYMDFASNQVLPDYKTVKEIIELGKTHIGTH